MTNEERATKLVRQWLNDGRSGPLELMEAIAPALTEAEGRGWGMAVKKLESREALEWALDYVSGEGCDPGLESIADWLATQRGKQG